MSSRNHYQHWFRIFFQVATKILHRTDQEPIPMQPVFKTSPPVDDSPLNFSEPLISWVLIHLMGVIPISPPANFLPRRWQGAKQSANPTPKSALTTATSAPLCLFLSWKTSRTPNNVPLRAPIPRHYWDCGFGHLHPSPSEAGRQQPGGGPAPPGLARGLAPREGARPGARAKLRVGVGGVLPARPCPGGTGGCPGLGSLLGRCRSRRL